MVRVGPTLVGQNTRTANARSVDRAELFHVGPLPASHVTAGAGPKVGSKTASVDSCLPRGGPYMHFRARGVWAMATRVWRQLKLMGTPDLRT